MTFQGGSQSLVLLLMWLLVIPVGLNLLLLLGHLMSDEATARGVRHALGGGTVESGGREGRQLLLGQEGPLRGRRLTPRVRLLLGLVLSGSELRLRFVLVALQRWRGWLIRWCGGGRTET